MPEIYLALATPHRFRGKVQQAEKECSASLELQEIVFLGSGSDRLPSHRHKPESTLSALRSPLSLELSRKQRENTAVFHRAPAAVQNADSSESWQAYPMALRVVGRHKSSITLDLNTATVLDLKEVIARESGLALGGLKLLAGAEEWGWCLSSACLSGLLYHTSSYDTITLEPRASAAVLHARSRSMRTYFACVVGPSLQPGLSTGCELLGVLLLRLDG